MSEIMDSMTQDQRNQLANELYDMLTQTVQGFFDKHNGGVVHGEMMLSAFAANAGSAIYHAPEEFKKKLMTTFVQHVSQHAGIHTAMVELADLPPMH